MPPRRVLIACYEVPGWGGASTASYSLFEMLRADGVDAAMVNIIGAHDSAYFRYRFGENMGNPRQLPAVYNCHLSGNNYRYHAQLHDLINEIKPDIMIGVGWIAAYVLKIADPSRRLVYLTTGCGWMGIYADQIRGSDLQSITDNELENPKAITIEDALEEDAIEMADLVVVHSDVNLRLYRTLYRGHAGKMYDKVVWFSEWICRDTLRYQKLRKPFKDREIDVLFVANDWSRPVKGFWLAKKIIKRLQGLEIQVVGELPEPAGGFCHQDFTADRASLFELMGNARAVVSPSSYDAAPGVLFEAAVMGRPTLSVTPRAAESEWLTSIGLGLTAGVHTREALRQTLDAAVADPARVMGKSPDQVISFVVHSPALFRIL